MIWRISICLFIFMNIIRICIFWGGNEYEESVKSLVLTELIEKGEITEAQTRAFVLLEDFRDVVSYSGYFQVDKEHDSNLFFWYFPSQSNIFADPVILWLQGGPGLTTFIALFYEGGPFKLENQFEIGLKSYSWIKNYSIVYMDSPVGTGYSYTKPEGYAKNQDTISQQLYNALRQFFKMFPALVNNEFYILGEGYAGKSAITLTELIHASNSNTTINLKGIVIGSGFCDPINQINYGDYLYEIGLIDQNIREQFYFVENCMKDHIERGKFKEAFKTYDYLINGDLDARTLFQNLTGIENHHNYLSATGLRDFIPILSYYVNLEVFRKALHVGMTHFNVSSPAVEENLEDDIMRSVISSLPPLLGTYKVLFYNGQLDILTRFDTTEKFLYNMTYEHIENFRNTKRCIWRVDNEIAGYAKSWGNLTQVLVRSAGHFVPTDQPKWALNMFNMFVGNINFCS